MERLEMLAELAHSYMKKAEDAEEAKELIESGFNYICTTPDELMLFKKRK